MSRIILPNPVNNKRLATRIDSTFDILFYGQDNLYPQTQEQLRLRSPLIKSATDLLEDFINGSGWELNGATIVNELTDTVTDVLNLVARDYALFNGFALHINYDGLGKIVGFQHIPFEFCRMSIPDVLGKVNEIVVSNNWERDSDKLESRGIVNTERFPVFNPSMAIPQLLSGRGNGQVLYYTGIEKDKYPLTSFDAIVANGESDEAMQIYERNNIKRGFHGISMFKFPGKIESEEEEAEIKKAVQAWNGEDAPGVTVFNIDEDFTGELIETIPANSDDTLFTATLVSVLERTLQNYRIPPALMGVTPSGGVFTQLAYLESFTVFNSVVRNRRDKIARIFNKLTDLWATGPFLVGRILENQFANEGEDKQVVSDKIITEEENGVEPRPDPADESGAESV